jgi:hypothetical protein
LYNTAWGKVSRVITLYNTAWGNVSIVITFGIYPYISQVY